VGTRKVRNKGREEIKKKRKKKKAHVGCFSYKLYRLFLSPHSLSVTTVTLGSRLFFNSAANKLAFENRCLLVWISMDMMSHNANYVISCNLSQ
jgi:hypothetical protein